MEPERRTRRSAGCAARALLGGLAIACAGGPPAEPPPEWDAALGARAARLELALSLEPAPPAGALEVLLAFPEGVDLDLYVTDPRLESVYYAHTPIRSGGALAEDRRCRPRGASGPRIERVRFAAPPAGRYRVGVDYPHDCGGGAGVVPYALEIRAPGGTQRLRGLAEPLRFDAVVLELELP